MKPITEQFLIPVRVDANYGGVPRDRVVANVCVNYILTPSNLEMTTTLINKVNLPISFGSNGAPHGPWKQKENEHIESPAKYARVKNELNKIQRRSETLKTNIKTPLVKMFDDGYYNNRRRGNLSTFPTPSKNSQTCLTAVPTILWDTNNPHALMDGGVAVRFHNVDIAIEPVISAGNDYIYYFYVLKNLRYTDITGTRNIPVNIAFDYIDPIWSGGAMVIEDYGTRLNFISNIIMNMNLTQYVTFPSVISNSVGSTIPRAAAKLRFKWDAILNRYIPAAHRADALDYEFAVEHVLQETADFDSMANISNLLNMYDREFIFGSTEEEIKTSIFQKSPPYAMQTASRLQHNLLAIDTTSGGTTRKRKYILNENLDYDHRFRGIESRLNHCDNYSCIVEDYTGETGNLMESHLVSYKTK